MAWLALKDEIGIFNACNKNTITIKNIIDYVKQMTGKEAILLENGEVAPYNGAKSYSLNTDYAAQNTLWWLKNSRFIRYNCDRI